MKWFKHYSNAHTNNFIENLLAQKNGHELHSMYWLLMELLCGEFKKDDSTFYIGSDRLMSALGIKYERKLKRFIQVLGEIATSFDQDCIKFTSISTQTSKEFWKIDAPILLELMGKDFKRTRSRSGSDTAKKKEERIKNKNKKTPAPAVAPSSLVTDVVNYLNEKTGKTFKSNSKATIQKINARSKDDYLFEDFKSVIDFKCEEWGRDPKWRQYLRPETLFSTKFEGYLEAAKDKAPSNALFDFFSNPEHGGIDE